MVNVMRIGNQPIPKVYVVLLALIGLYWILSVTSYFFLPEKVAVHWSGIMKEPNNYAGRASVAFLLPGLPTILLSLLIGPGFAFHMLRSSIAVYYDRFVFATVCYLTLLCTGLLVWNIIGRFDFSLMAGIATGIYCLVVVEVFAVGAIRILTVARRQRRGK